MTGRRALAVAASAALAVLPMLAGCGSSRGGSTVAGAAAADDTAAYRARAGLDDCPAATAATPNALTPLTLPCLGGGAATVDLSRVRGPALVNMWASWCDPCVEEVPILERVHRTTKGRLLVLGVDIQETSRRSPLAFAARMGMHYPSLYDADGRFRVTEHAPAPPVTLFVDAEGKVVHRKTGRYRHLDDLRADLARYLGVRA